MMDELFADLPEQRPPRTLYADNCALELCSRCGGTGREECPYPSHWRVAQEWEPTCRGCQGRKGIMRHWKPAP